MSINIQEYRELDAKLRKARKENGKKWVTAAILPALKASPFNRIRWAHYTPSFNDGDPCVFSTTLEHYSILDDAAESLEEALEEDTWDETWGSDQPAKVLDYGDEDVLEAAFGDNVQITAILNDDGSVTFETEEYYCGY